METPSNLQLARNRTRAALICAWLASLLAAWAVSAIDDHLEDEGADELELAAASGRFRWSDDRAAGFREGFESAQIAQNVATAPEA
jgi:hypothetical protein